MQAENRAAMQAAENSDLKEMAEEREGEKEDEARDLITRTIPDGNGEKRATIISDSTEYDAAFEHFSSIDLSPKGAGEFRCEL
ncbi:hypothetical protein D5086_020267 [Populus alba]|uniref:Uncharacterized protein n=1 Tax=Populus alba TaxID=43335 RepID=A0ACC4BL60_POPAL